MSSLKDLLVEIAKDIHGILKAPYILIADAKPPKTAGVYMFSVGGNLAYVGEAKGSGGLYDRIMKKHVSGDDRHAAQRAYLKEFPDRNLRREHIKQNVSARWIEIPDFYRVSAVEQVLICLYRPEWNKDRRLVEVP